MTCIAREGKQACQRPREVGALFCAGHMAAPAAQRGGWLSAERRRRQLGASKETALDASNIVKRLWVGGEPPFDRHLPEFDSLVLCARERQPERIGFQGHLIRVPLPDNALTDDEIRRSLTGAKRVADDLRGGKRVLVTCYAGLNRSALVAGLALGMISRLSAGEIVLLIRKQRSESALHNTHFVVYLERFVGAWRKDELTRQRK